MSVFSRELNTCAWMHRPPKDKKLVVISILAKLLIFK